MTKTKSRKKSKATPAFTLASPSSSQMSLLSSAPTAPAVIPETRLQKFERRVAAVLDRMGLTGLAVVRNYQARVKAAFENNDTDARCANELFLAFKESQKAKKNWWKPRPKTCDDRIAKKFAKCKSMEMF